MKTIRVRVGYGWQKNVDDCTKDTAWTSIRDRFKKINDGIERDYDVKVSFGRLRASHGRFIWESIAQKIRSADILIFDVAAAPLTSKDGEDKKPCQFNHNVLIELGAAMIAEPSKRVIILCPEEMADHFPSDMSGFLLTKYKRSQDAKNSSNRMFADGRGLFPAYQAMLREIIEEDERIEQDKDGCTCSSRRKGNSFEMCQKS